MLIRDGGALAKLMGRRYTSRAKLLGMPAISIAYGIGPDGKPGHAKGWIALGDKATGVLAVGGFAMGGVTLGGLSVGVFSIGGMSVGLLTAFGGCSVSPLGMAMGGCAIGLLATGGMAIGVGATGGFTLGVFGWGPPQSTIAMFKLTPRGEGAPEAKVFFDSLSWLFGSPRMGSGMLRAAGWQLAVLALATISLALPAFIKWQRSDDDDAPTPYNRT